MIDVALRRAALRVPGRAATASLASFRALRARLAAAPLPEPAPHPGPLRTVANEYWCTVCGSEGIAGPSQRNTATTAKRAPRCFRCGSTSLVAVSVVLREGEFV